MEPLSRRELLAAVAVAALCPRPASADPASATLAVLAFVGVELARGAVTYIGGQITESLLDQLGILQSPEKRIAHKVVDVIRSVVRAELQEAFSEQEINDVQYDMSGISSNLYTYLSARPKSRRSLESLLTISLNTLNRDISVSRNHGLMGLHLYAGLVTLKLIVLQSFHTDINRHDRSFVATAEELIKEAVSHINSLIAVFRESTSVTTRLSPINCGSRTSYQRTRDGGSVAVTVSSCSFTIDGQLAGDKTEYYKTDDEVHSALQPEYDAKQAALTAFAAQGEEQFVQPLNATRSQWNSIRFT